MAQFAKMVLLLFGIILLTLNNEAEFVECSKYIGRHTIFQFREKPRSTRGFKSAALSTARGFGKRNFGLVFKTAPEADPSLSYLLRKSTQRKSVPIEWLVDEMQNNPELTRFFLKTFVDVDRNDEITPDELLLRLNQVKYDDDATAEENQ